MCDLMWETGGQGRTGYDLGSIATSGMIIKSMQNFGFT